MLQTTNHMSTSIAICGLAYSGEKPTRHAKPTESCLSKCSQSIQVQEDLSVAVMVECGVPYLGQKTFVDYADDMDNIFVADAILDLLTTRLRANGNTGTMW